MSAIPEPNSREMGESLYPAVGFIASFVLIGTYWLEHYAIFHFLTRATRMPVVLDGLFLRLGNPKRKREKCRNSFPRLRFGLPSASK